MNSMCIAHRVHDLSIDLSIYPYIHAYIHTSTHPPISIYLPTHLPIHLTTYLPTLYLPICLPTNLPTHQLRLADKFSKGFVGEATIIDEDGRELRNPKPHPNQPRL